jgi:hypothetical protein
MTAQRHRTNTETPNPSNKGACCLKTQQHAKPYKPHHTHTLIPTPTTTPKGSSKRVLRKHEHHAATANTTTHHINDACFSGIEFIDIPPMSNPPANTRGRNGQPIIG